MTRCSSAPPPSPPSLELDDVLEVSLQHIQDMAPLVQRQLLGMPSRLGVHPAAIVVGRIC